MASSDMAKPATACAANGLRNCEQLGRRLEKQDNNATETEQAETALAAAMRAAVARKAVCP